MKRPLRIALTTLGVLVAIPVLLVATTAVVNVVATSNEASSITDYGQRVPVDGKKMNVVLSGDGDQTIVLLPGLGTAAPGVDFQPLIDELDDTYRVVAVEPFGTGLSDPPTPSAPPRTSPGRCTEVGRLQGRAPHHDGGPAGVMVGVATVRNDGQDVGVKV